MNAIDAVYALRIGDRFALRGRSYEFRCYTGFTSGEGYVRFKTLNAEGKATWTTVRESDSISIPATYHS